MTVTIAVYDYSFVITGKQITPADKDTPDKLAALLQEIADRTPTPPSDPDPAATIANAIIRAVGKAKITETTPAPFNPDVFY